jgi:hypothetical protein
VDGPTRADTPVAPAVRKNSVDRSWPGFADRPCRAGHAGQIRKRPDGKWWWRAIGELVDTFCADFNWLHGEDDPPQFIFPNRRGWVVFGPFDHKEQAKASIVSFFARTRPAWTMEKAK